MKYLFLILGIILSSLSLRAQNQTFCEEVALVKSKQDLTNALMKKVSEHNQKFTKGYGRHQIGEALNECTPSEDSKALVITFAGTSAYNPRSHHLMRELFSCPEFKDLPDNLRDDAYVASIDALKRSKSKFTKWSGINRGVMQESLRSKNLFNIASGFEYAIFPSEEFEFLDNTKKITADNIKSTIKELSLRPKGIVNALKCASKYFKTARAKGLSPKFILQGYSSGGRSVVKFLKEFNSYNLKYADLVITIDPVIEAHIAILDVANQYAGYYGSSAWDYIWGEEIKPIRAAVWSRKQPRTLYKTSNARRWINFYQNKDTEGLKTGLKFGICGSPISAADHNYYFSKDLGSAAHGQIPYNATLLSRYKNEIVKLFN